MYSALQQAILQRRAKATSRKGRKAIEERGPKLIENPKKLFIFKGRKTSERTRALFEDFYLLRKPHVQKYLRLNDTIVFEDATYAEYHCKKFDASLFLTCSHSKKRPHNIVVGRMFNHLLFDMVELGIDSIIQMNEIKNAKVPLYTKPALIFNGIAWEESEDLKTLRSIFTDFFYREDIESIRLQGIEHIICFTATNESKILMRSYRILFKKSGQKTPRVELVETGPSIDFSLRRTKTPSEDLRKEAFKLPPKMGAPLKKNTSIDPFGTKHGRVHLGVQDVEKLQTRKMKGLKKTSAEKAEERLMKKRKARSTNSESEIDRRPSKLQSKIDMEGKLEL